MSSITRPAGRTVRTVTTGTRPRVGFLIKPILPALLVLGLGGPAPASAQDATRPIQFRVSLDAALGATPVSGRLLIYMTVNDKPLEVTEPGFGAEVKNVWIVAREVQSLAPGAEVVLGW